MKSQLSRAIKYLIYSISFFILIYIGLKNLINIQEKPIEDYNPIYYFRFMVVLGYIIGVFFAIPRLLKLFNYVGRWRLNAFKITFLGVPFIYASIIPLFNIGFHFPFSDYLMGGYFGETGSNLFLIINSIAAGFFITSSIKRDQNIA